MSDFFKTIKGTSQGIYKEKMSKFIAFAVPVATADEAKAVVKRYANEYHDARHCCWAYERQRRAQWHGRQTHSGPNQLV